MGVTALGPARRVHPTTAVACVLLPQLCFELGTELWQRLRLTPNRAGLSTVPSPWDGSSAREARGRTTEWLQMLAACLATSLSAALLPQASTLVRQFAARLRSAPRPMLLLAAAPA